MGTSKPGKIKKKFSHKANTSLEIIKSKYVIDNIISYINEEAFFLKLIKYSKYFKKKYNIQLLNYKEKYIEGKINFEDYFFEKSVIKNIDDEELKINLYNDLENKLSEYQIDKESINIIVINYFKKYYNNLNNKKNSLYEFSKNIDINSPFFDILSKTEYFNKIFNIVISTKFMEKFNLESEYISKFEKLNKSKFEYSSLNLYSKDTNDIHLLTKFNINLNKLKKLSYISEDDCKIDYNHVITTINSFNIYNTLVYLKLKLGFGIKPKFFLKI